MVRTVVAGMEESLTWHREDGLKFTRTSLGVVKIEREARGAGDQGFMVMLGPWEWAQVVERMRGAAEDDVKPPFLTEEQAALWDLLEYARHAEGCNGEFGDCTCGFADVLARPAVRRCWHRGVEVARPGLAP